MMDPLLISGIVFVSVTVLIVTLYVLVRGLTPKKVEDRLQVLAGFKTQGEGTRAKNGPNGTTLMREGLQGLTATANKFLGRFGNLPLLLEQADVAIKLDVFLAISCGLGLVGVVLAMIASSPVPLYPVAFLCCSLLPLMWVMYMRKKRLAKFAQQLPDALELIGRALRSGHSLSSGLHMVIEEMPAPISTEFGLAYEEQNLGHPLEQALKNMLKRVPNMDLKFFVTAVAIQKQAGGDLAEILDKIGHIVRERFKIMGLVQALTGEGRISGIVLMALPIAIFVAVYQLNPGYMMVLFEDPMGRKMIAVAAFLQVLGAVVIKKIIAIKI